MPSNFFLHHVIQSWLGFQFLRLILVVPATNVFSEPFPWLVLNRLHKTCSQIVSIEILQKCLSRKCLTLIIVIIIIVTVHVFTVDKKGFT